MWVKREGERDRKRVRGRERLKDRERDEIDRECLFGIVFGI